MFPVIVAEFEDVTLKHGRHDETEPAYKLAVITTSFAATKNPLEVAPFAPSLRISATVRFTFIVIGETLLAIRTSAGSNG
jgi:hypothetical protein